MITLQVHLCPGPSAALATWLGLLFHCTKLSMRWRFPAPTSSSLPRWNLLTNRIQETYPMLPSMQKVAAVGLFPSMRRLPQRSRENFCGLFSRILPPLQWKTYAMLSLAKALRLYSWITQTLKAICPFLTSRGKSHQRNKSSYPTLCQHPPCLTNGMPSPTP